MRSDFAGDKLVCVLLVIWVAASLLFLCFNLSHDLKASAAIRGDGPSHSFQSQAINPSSQKTGHLANDPHFKEIVTFTDYLGWFIFGGEVLARALLLWAAILVWRGKSLGFWLVIILSFDPYFKMGFYWLPFTISIPLAVYCLLRLFTGLGPQPIRNPFPRPPMY